MDQMGGMTMRDEGEGRDGWRAANWKGHGLIGASFWYGVRKNAAARGIGFDLTIEEAWEKFQEQGGVCVYSGLVLTFGGRGSPGNASIDRRDSSLGYSPDNIQWVDKRVNMMKQSLPEGEFIELCALIADRSGREVDRCQLRFA